MTVAGLLLGVGLGGFIDGIVIHQILQWHHMGTGHVSTFPRATVSSLEDNTLWDGLFHLGTWILSIVGLFLLRRALATEPTRTTWLGLTGLMLAGWGMFNVVEGLVNHQLLGLHHVRDDLGGPASWDIGFLLFGCGLAILGLVVHRSERHSELRSETVERARGTT